jgi:hypothetical protein
MRMTSAEYLVLDFFSLADIQIEGEIKISRLMFGS